jgi:two-component system, chemotaxis family, protein-glutamate methylesterase/glutaminase
VSADSTGAHDLVAVGASWGGLGALRLVLGGLPREFPASVVVVQHRSPESHPTALRDLLGAVTRLTVREAGDKQVLEPGCVYLAPPDYHTLVEGDHLELSVDAPVEHSRPSIDVLFETAAEARRGRCTGVVLTGANADGARGLARIAELGGAAVVQDPEQAERSEMPRAALAAVPTARVVPLEKIAGVLVERCAEGGGRA